MLNPSKLKSEGLVGIKCSAVAGLSFCSSHPTMGQSHRRYLVGQRVFGCSTCFTHLATIESMLSRVRWKSL